MHDVTNKNFGLLIAYLLPGFVTLIGVSFISPTVASWLTISHSALPTVGGFLYVTMASVGFGLTVSTIRWALIDPIHHRTGIPLPNRNFGNLPDKLSAYQYVVSTTYQYYQFYSGMAVALALTFAMAVATAHVSSGWLWLGFVLAEIIFWAAARDTLRKYYEEGQMLLGHPLEEGSAHKDAETD